MLRKSVWAIALLVSSAQASQPVTVDAFVRAETDTALRTQLSLAGGEFGQFFHRRQPASVEEQTVIRTNRDTLYSGAILDLSTPVTITLPDTGGRYMSMQVINQDHYMFVESSPGEYKLTEDNVGTRFAVVIVRTFAAPNSAEDIKAANDAQDGLRVSGGGKGPFEAPDWDQEDLSKARGALNELSTLGFDSFYAFGRMEDVRPIDHLVGAAAGWGGLPASEAQYVISGVSRNDGLVPHTVTVKDVPVDAFWSVTVYNAEGYLERNKLGINSYNNVTAASNDDGSYTINFGGCADGRVNCIPITPGWNYTVRLYQPRKEILHGEWIFPTPLPAR